VLYGRDGQPHRWHQAEDVPIPGGCLFGLDLFRPDPDGQPGDGLLVAHLRTTIPEILPLLRGIAHRRGVPPILPVPAEILPDPISLRPAARPYTAAFLTWTSDQPPELGEPAQVPGWDATDQWRWALASRTTRHDFPPDPDHADALLDGTVIFSADWRALINRDGAAFVALRPAHTDFVTDEVVDRFCLIGPPDEHIRRLAELRALGVDQFALYLQHDAKDATLAGYGEHVIGAVNARAAALL
jgi:hypothetical protein